jgi:cyclophilin family peptidyl-prolyl cis-trans isomerase
MFSIRFLPKVLCALVLGVIAFTPAISQASMVRLITVLGPIDIALDDTATATTTAAPQTVTNFLSYVNNGAYSNSFIHRSMPGFVIQGGGYTWDSTTNGVKAIPVSAPVNNEFSTSRSNLRGTVAMALSGTDANSATNQWFINLADNSSLLDFRNANGGPFTVFGKVTSSGMKVADAIAALSTGNAGGAFTNLPMISRPTSGSLQQANLVMIQSASLITPATDSDRLFNYLEATYPQYLPLPGSVSATATVSGTVYYYRHYPGTNAYIATANGSVYYLVPSISGNITQLDTLANLLATAVSAGY